MLEIKRLIHSFSVAMNGIKNTFIYEKNMQIHGWIALAVLGLCFWANIPWWQYLVILFLILWVWALELINTAVERAFDLVSKERNLSIQLGKDAAAGAVLLSAILAVIIGITILYKPLIIQVDRFHDLLTMSLVPTAFQLAVMICIWFFFFGVMIKMNKKFGDALILLLLGLSCLFALFIWTQIAWLQLLMLLLPPFIMIFVRRGIATLYGMFQVLISGFGVYLLYYLLK